jgi:beta-fructofuranosidase
MLHDSMSSNIRKAQEEINQKKAEVEKGKMRQNYHFMPQTGWLNDPNGLIYYKGKYHFFYQYYPYAGFWGSMHWGHAISSDMINWEHLPLALAPSEDYDNHYQGGCFSGSAIEHDNKLFLMYTGTANHGKGFEQSQCIAFSEDGINFTKYEGNPVITAPKGIPKDYFRDPKVWKHEGTYYMVCGANNDGKAQALLYKSEDMYEWSFFSVLAESRGEWGYMWECPDFFYLNGKYVLTFSPMGVQERTSVYMVGDFDYKTGKFFCSKSDEIDWGFDYYAPQSFLAPDGRRIVVSWSNEWDWMPFWKDWGPTYREGWCGFFNIPREVELLEDNTLQFKPIREIYNLRESSTLKEEIVLSAESEEIVLESGSCLELKIKINLAKSSTAEICFELRSDGSNYTHIIFDLEKSEVRFDRNNSDGWSKGIARGPLKLIKKTSLDIHIFIDQSSIEVFSNEYQCNLSCNVFAKKEQSKNKLFIKSGTLHVKEVESWILKNR